MGSLTAPPEAVKRTLEAVCRLLGVAPPRIPGRKRNGGHVPDYFAAASKLMKQPRAFAARLRAPVQDFRGAFSRIGAAESGVGAQTRTNTLSSLRSDLSALYVAGGS